MPFQAQRSNSLSNFTATNSAVASSFVLPSFWKSDDSLTIVAISSFCNSSFVNFFELPDQSACALHRFQIFVNLRKFAWFQARRRDVIGNFVKHRLNQNYFRLQNGVRAHAVLPDPEVGRTSCRRGRWRCSSVAYIEVCCDVLMLRGTWRRGK